MKEYKEYFLKDTGIRIWTTEGFKNIKKVIHIKGEFDTYEVEVDDNIKAIIPSFFSVKTPRGYIKPDKLSPQNDAIVCHSEKNLNTLKTLLKIKKREKPCKELIIIKLQDSPVVRTFTQSDDRYSCLDSEGNKTNKKLKEIREGDFVQVGDEFKEVLCKKTIEDNEGIIIINMNNDAIFLNDICVIPNLKKLKKE